MKILDRYIVLNFLVLLLTAVAVITFIVSLGVIFKVTELLAKGASATPLINLFFSGMPSAFVLAIPMGALVSTLLFFGRLSSDNEIIALKACGVSIYRIAAPLLVIGLFLTILCLFIHSELAPRAHLTQKQALAVIKFKSPIDALEEGRFMNDFIDGVTFYVGKKMKDSSLQDVRIYDARDPDFVRQIHALSATVEIEDNDMIINLLNVTISPFAKDSPNPATCDRLPFTMEGRAQKREYEPKEDDFTFAELLERLVHFTEYHSVLDEKDAALQRSRLLVEFNKRLSLSFSCFAFIFLAIPLGTKAHRKESSVGIAMSLLVVMNFYIFIIVAESLKNRPGCHAEFIIWIPVILSVIIGTWLMKKSR